MAAIDRLRQVVRHVAAVAVAEGSSENQVLAGVDDEEIVRAGEAQALAAPNRGPLLVHGKLNPAIAPLFEEWGFFVLEGVIGDEELEDLRADIGGLIDRAPVSKGSELDKFGRPAEKAQWNIQPPLSDPNGGRGRSPAKGMRTPTPAADAPKEVPMSLQSYLPHSEAGLRLYAHPGLLALAAAVNGNTFCPFSESIQIKLPGLGPSVTWHQDGTTHWEQPEPEHGFNFMCQVRITVLRTCPVSTRTMSRQYSNATPYVAWQLYGSTAENGVWVVPKSHRVGRIDIPELVQKHGDRIPGALPMVCKPGDVVIANRNCLQCVEYSASDLPLVQASVARTKPSRSTPSNSFNSFFIACVLDQACQLTAACWFCRLTGGTVHRFQTCPKIFASR
jgi:hypothetical protein